MESDRAEWVAIEQSEIDRKEDEGEPNLFFSKDS